MMWYFSKLYRANALKFWANEWAGNRPDTHRSKFSLKNIIDTRNRISFNKNYYQLGLLILEDNILIVLEWKILKRTERWNTDFYIY
jgi:hypothetical protein